METSFSEKMSNGYHLPPQRLTRSSGLILGFLISIVPLPVWAQITPDTSLGAERSNVLPTNVIDGGARRGANLFHSFLQFNINSGQRIDFANPLGVDRIFTRVTGNTRSTILGTLGVLGNADLFLINPNGILFGPNAQLDVRGSFIASTADGLLFDNRFTFSTTNPQSPPLLTVQTPIGLQYGSRPGAIAVQGASLAVPRGKTLALVGGNVNIDNATLLAFEGRVELGSLAGAGIVGLGSTGNAPSLQFAETTPRANITLNASQIVVDAEGNGDVVINARNIQVLNQSFIGAGIFSSSGATNNRAGDITLNASEAIAIQGNSLLLNSVASGAVGTGGNINVVTGSLLLNEKSQIATILLGRGTAGNVTVRATGAVTIDGQTDTLSGGGIFTAVAPGAIGNSGNVAIAANELSLLRGGSILSGIFGTGRGGNVDIQVQGATVLDGVNPQNSRASGIASQLAPGSVGTGGNVQISTGSLAVTNGAALSVSTNGRGNAGNLKVRATDTALFDGEGFLDGGNTSISRASSQVQENGIGNAGNIEMSVGSLILRNGAQISTSTFGKGNAGNVNLNAETMSFDGLSRTNFASGLSSTVERGAVGQGGNVDINTGSLTVTNGAVLNVTTNGQGNAGNVDVRARGAVLLTGASPDNRLISGIFGRVNPNGVGQGGNITLAADSLTLTDRARISTSTQGQGDAGTLRITARDSVSVVGSSDPTVSSGLFSNVVRGAIGNGGTIFMTTNDLTMQQNAQIIVTSEGGGQAGNIQIAANNVSLSQKSQISAATTSNQGGDITLNVRDVLLLRRNSLISTSAGTAQAGGDGGNIRINAGFIVSVLSENNDIRANAFTGRGGNINITAQGIYGIKFQPFDTLNSDITASSQFGLSGIVTLNTPGIDPTQGTATLPATFSTPPLAQGCAAPGNQASRFVSAGRGGVSTNPAAPLTPETIWQDLETRFESTSEDTKTQSSTSSQTSSELVEAQAWEKTSDGAISLTAQAPRPLTPNCTQFHFMNH